MKTMLILTMFFLITMNSQNSFSQNNPIPGSPGTLTNPGQGNGRPASSTPEPGTLAALALGSAAVYAKRKFYNAKTNR